MIKTKAPDAMPKMLGLRLNLTAAERDQLRIASAKAGFPSMAIYCRHLVLAGIKAGGRK